MCGHGRICTDESETNPAGTGFDQGHQIPTATRESCSPLRTCGCHRQSDISDSNSVVPSFIPFIASGRKTHPSRNLRECHKSPRTMEWHTLSISSSHFTDLGLPLEAWSPMDDAERPFAVLDNTFLGDTFFRGGRVREAWGFLASNSNVGM